MKISILPVKLSMKILFLFAVLLTSQTQAFADFRLIFESNQGRAVVENDPWLLGGRELEVEDLGEQYKLTYNRRFVHDEAPIIADQEFVENWQINGPVNIIVERRDDAAHAWVGIFQKNIGIGAFINAQQNFIAGLPIFNGPFGPIRPAPIGIDLNFAFENEQRAEMRTWAREGQVGHQIGILKLYFNK